jgi:hypothetical protein
LHRRNSMRNNHFWLIGIGCAFGDSLLIRGKSAIVQFGGLLFGGRCSLCHHQYFEGLESEEGVNCFHRTNHDGIVQCTYAYMKYRSAYGRQRRKAGAGLASDE